MERNERGSGFAGIPFGCEFSEGLLTRLGLRRCRGRDRSAWRSQKQNLSFFRKRFKMQAPSNSCPEPLRRLQRTSLCSEKH